MKILGPKILVALAVFSLSGCPLEGDSGRNGVNGTNGIDGLDGVSGINCWDLNENRNDDPIEDTNGDGEWNVGDCSPSVSTGVTQNIGVELNHQHICEALANLGQYPEGCPSAAHTTPIGTLTRLAFMLDDGTGQRGLSCNLEPNNGALTLEKKPVDQLYYWSLEGGFVAGKTVIPLEDELNETAGNSCFDVCQNDPKCIATLSVSRDITIGDSRRIVYDCAIFHSSDSVPAFAQKCDDSFDNCAGFGNALEASQRWSVLCP